MQDLFVFDILLGKVMTCLTAFLKPLCPHPLLGFASILPKLYYYYFLKVNYYGYPSWMHRETDLDYVLRITLILFFILRDCFLFFSLCGKGKGKGKI